MKPWLQSRLPSIIITVVVVALLVGVMAVAVTRDTGGADALTVNGQSVSQATINQELQALVANKLVTSNAEGSADARAAAQWLTTRVRSEAILKLVNRNGLQITSSDRSQVRAQLPPGFAKLSSATQDLVLNFSAGGLLLVDKLGADAATAALTKVVRLFDVSVDPKYGRWARARAEVCPPLGCAALDTQSSSGG